MTLLHAGRSSQEMHATYRAAILRDDVLALADQLNKASRSLIKLAGRHTKTIVPNTPTLYPPNRTATPTTYWDTLPASNATGSAMREAYERIDRCAMGTTVLNGTSWPLNRTRMADYLGFATIVDNAYDASQISSLEHPVEVGAVVTSIALHVGNFWACSSPWSGCCG